MKSRRVFLLVMVLLLAALPAAAQSTPLLALVNNSGQLIVSSADGAYRWIVTNPGETLAGYAWLADSLYFAVNTGAGSSLRAADVNSQSVSEVGQVPGSLLSVSSDGAFIFYQQADGSYALQAGSGSAVALASLRNDAGAPYSGLWSNAAPLVAYWGYGGNSVLAVTSAANGQTLTLDSGRSTPITPLAWLPESTQLIFRDGSGLVRLADLTCLTSTCAGNPLDDGTALLPAGAADVETDGSWVYFRSEAAIDALNLSCVPANNCAETQAVVISGNAAPQTVLHSAGGVLVYTAYTSNPNDPNDREVRRVDLACVSSGACAPQMVASGAVAGALSADGRFAVVEQSGGLSSLDLSTGALAYLSDRGVPLASVRWQP